VHKDNLPSAGLFLEEGRFQPLPIDRSRRIGDAAAIHVGDPCGVAVNVDIWFGYIPFIALPRSMLSLDQGHDGIAVEASTSIEQVKVRCRDGVEFFKIIGAWNIVRTVSATCA